MTSPPPEPAPLLLDRDGPAAVITINRPERLNAVTFAMFARLPALLAEAAELPGVRALVLRGAGTRAFSAGADIGEFTAVRSTPEHAATYDEAVLAAEEALAGFPMPTIAAVHGDPARGQGDNRAHPGRGIRGRRVPRGAARRRSREPRLRGGCQRLPGTPLPPVRLISRASVVKSASILSVP
jgi:enoyl-CoA hydratase/isomerase-like protein